MFKLRLVVSGMSVWVRSTTTPTFDVLFPVAIQPMPDQHHPHMTVCFGSRDMLDFDLSGWVLDLTGSVSAPAITSITVPHWMLPLAPTAGSAVLSPAVVDNSTVVWSAIRLPQHSTEVLVQGFRSRGPVAYNGHDYWLDYKTEWTVDIPESDLALPLRSQSASTGGLLSTTLIKLDSADIAAAKSVKIAVSNQTSGEHRGTVRATKNGDTLTDVADAHALVGATTALPFYNGPDLEFNPYSLKALKNDPILLCPHMYVSVP